MIVFDQPIDLNPRIDIQRVLGDVEDRRYRRPLLDLREADDGGYLK